MTKFRQIIDRGSPRRHPKQSVSPSKLKLSSSTMGIADGTRPVTSSLCRGGKPRLNGRMTITVSSSHHHHGSQQPKICTDNVALLALSLSTRVIIEKGGACGNELSDRVGHKLQLAAATVRNADLKEGLLRCRVDAKRELAGR